jgi:hypothetical protein
MERLILKTPLYSTRIRVHDLFAGYVQVSFIISWFNLVNVPQVAHQLQARFNVQLNLSQDWQRRFDEIRVSSIPQDHGDDSTVTAPPRKRRRTDNLDPDRDDQPSVDEEEADEIKRLGRCYVLLRGPWLRRKELIFKDELDEDYDENERFNDANTIAQGQLHEIRDLLPEKYLGDAFTKKWLSKSVSNICFLYECTNCSFSSSREWTHNDRTLLHASEKLLLPYLALTHWI